jgi:integrase/recombinase XerD
MDTRQEIVKGHIEHVKALNKHIEDVRFKIKEKYRLLCDKETLITAETVKQAYLGTHTVLKGHKLVELLDYYDKSCMFFGSLSRFGLSQDSHLTISDL